MNYKFVKLDAITAPTFNVDKRSEIVKYGRNNRLPQELLDLSTQSSLHTAILDKKITMSKGEGLSSDDERTKLWLETANPYESWDDIYEKCATDLEIFGGFSLETIWTKDKKQVAEVYHIPFQNIRSGKNNDKNQVETYFYNEDWKLYTRYNDAKTFPVFNTQNNKDLNQLMYAKKYSATNAYYPLPSYFGAINDINTLYDISIFHNSCIKNNFQPGIMIFFRGVIPSPEEQDAIVRALEDKYKGSQNAGTPGIFFLENEQEQPQIENIGVTDLDKQYTTLTEGIKESVVMGHQIPRIVAGAETPGSLGGSKEIIEANMIFSQEYVYKQQDFILKYFNKIAKINGLDDMYVVNGNIPLHLYSESLLTQVLSQDEIRELFGYEPIEIDEVVVDDEPEKTNEINDEQPTD